MIRQLTEITDVSLESISRQAFDLAIFVSGYETRSVFLAADFNANRCSRISVLGFENNVGNQTRQKNDKFYKDKYNLEPIIVPSSNVKFISEFLNSQLPDDLSSADVFVDISSMSRNWYAEIINWARFDSNLQCVNLFFAYVPGAYKEASPSRTITITSSLHAFEGRADVGKETVALLGLGYDPITVEAAIEDLQPELKYGFVAGGGNKQSLLRAIEINEAILDEFDGPLTVIPILSVNSAYRLLEEMAIVHSGSRNVVFVCLGPKTHVLASLLVACKHEEITCLHIQGHSKNPIDVFPEEALFSGTKVKFKPDQIG